MRKKLLGSAAVGLVWCTCISADGAFAQSALVPAEGGAAVQKVGQLQEVIVTAQRRTQNIQKTAIPITAITGSEIKAQGKTQLDQVLNDVPSVQIQSAPNGADVVIRGVGGNDVGGIQQDPDVSVMEDSVYSGQPASITGSVYDTQRVEVLRGPQGTLYGRNAAGGAINILTNDPGPKLGAGVTLGYGNFDQRHADGYLNVPITDDLSFRVAAERDLSKGFYSNGAGNVDNTGFRAKVKYTPNADLSFLARFDYWHTENNTSTVPIPGSPGPFAPANPSDPWNTNLVGQAFLGVLPTATDDHFYTSSLQIDYDLGFGTITLIPSLTRSVQVQSSESLFAPASFPNGSNATNEDQYTGEARINSAAGSPFKWVGGVYVLESQANQIGTAAGSTTDAPYTTLGNNARPASSVGGFAQATYPVTDKFRTTLGGRYNVDSKGVTFGVCSVTAPSTNCNGDYYSPVSKLSSSYNSFTYKGGVEYDITQTAMAYAQVSTGYKAGGYSTATTPPVAYQPESLTDYEVGLKSRWLSNTLQFNADAFFYQYHNQQLELHVVENDSAFIPSYTGDDTTNENLDVNAGNSQYKGVEAQTKYQVTSNDQINFDIAYEAANYGHFVIDTLGGPPGTSCACGTYFNLTGQQEAHAPKWNGSVGYQHVFDIGPSTLTFASSTHFQTQSYTTIQEWFAGGNTIQKGYHQTDLNLNYADGSNHWRVGLWVRNLENNAIVNYIYPLYKETLNSPRTYGATVSYAY